jgi:glycosyltransferase involved in cell wall biosynthesis
VNFEQFYTSEHVEDYFLIVSRLIPYKRIDIVIEAFNSLGWPLVIIGDGYDKPRLQSLAKSNVRFMGFQPDEVITEYYSKCKAFILGGEEDFGITPLEAQASGRPVIAYRKGGALETVKEFETGVFFDEPTADSLLQAITKFQELEFDSQRIRAHANKFSREKFKQEVSQFIQSRIKGATHE